uniref:Ovule protein n=1 Tax=Haemonchus placei TaxID=6290 RepID=A0A0N4WPH4_HAEPC
LSKIASFRFFGGTTLGSVEPNPARSLRTLDSTGCCRPFPSFPSPSPSFQPILSRRNPLFASLSGLTGSNFDTTTAPRHRSFRNRKLDLLDCTFNKK